MLKEDLDSRIAYKSTLIITYLIKETSSQEQSSFKDKEQGSKDWLRGKSGEYHGNNDNRKDNQLKLNCTLLQVS